MKIIIIGAGSSGIATAISLINEGFNPKDITMLEKGNSINKRHCFVNESTPCKKCKICSITHGCGGAGSFSDSKLNFDNTGRIRGDMAELMSQDEIQYYLEKTSNIYKQFGIDEFSSKVYGVDNTTEGLEIINMIHQNPKLDIGECATIHLGTENSRIIYNRMLSFLEDQGVEILTNAEVVDINAELKTVHYKYKAINEIKTYDKLVVAMGRSGNSFVKTICEKNKIEMKSGKAEIGVRIECPDEIMRRLNENFYECKIYFKGSFGDNARMFCTNPSGFVTIESYNINDKKLYTANGHAYANKKSTNTNFAILVSRSFNGDMHDPLLDYVYPLVQSTNSLGKGSVILQSLKDIKLNRRSTEDRIASLDIAPTAKAYAGDLTSSMPYRTLTTILEFIEELDTIVPGINGDTTLLYGLECKFTSNKVLINKHGLSSNKDIYFIGDGSGWTRGLTSAISHGILCAESIIKEIE